ncbi:MAG: GNAT family N-acetyltransferase [Micrococcales bacterium]
MRQPGVGSGRTHKSQSAEDLEQEFKNHLELKNAQFFAVEDVETGKVIGSTAFLDIRPKDRHVEIGHTFLAPRFRGGNRNTEMKLLMLTEAFENRGCVRVTLKANSKNLASRRAIEKIGAKFEGLLRNHREERDGSWRTSAYYSVIIEEWPDTKRELTQALLGKKNLA